VNFTEQQTKKQKHSQQLFLVAGSFAFLKQSNKEACPYFTFIYCPTFAPFLNHDIENT